MRPLCRMYLFLYQVICAARALELNLFMFIIIFIIIMLLLCIWENSDWFFLGWDFTLWTISTEKVMHVCVYFLFLKTRKIQNFITN